MLIYFTYNLTLYDELLADYIRTWQRFKLVSCTGESEIYNFNIDYTFSHSIDFTIKTMFSNWNKLKKELFAFSQDNILTVGMYIEIYLNFLC